MPLVICLGKAPEVLGGSASQFIEGITDRLPLHRPIAFWVWYAPQFNVRNRVEAFASNPLAPMSDNCLSEARVP